MVHWGESSTSKSYLLIRSTEKAIKSYSNVTKPFSNVMITDLKEILNGYWMKNDIQDIQEDPIIMRNVLHNIAVKHCVGNIPW